MPGEVSLREMGDLLADLKEKVDGIRAMRFTHWVSPYFEVQPALGINIGPQHEPRVQILNLNSTPVDVQVNFINTEGDLLPFISTVLKNVPARGFAEHRPLELSGEINSVGWIEVKCSKPIYPSGQMSAPRQTPAPPGKFNTPVAVAFSLQFYPVVDED